MADVANKVIVSKRTRVFVVPVHYGSGTRLKILSAFAMGIPTVSTPIGAEGIECRDGHDIMIADGGDEMARAIGRLFSDDTLHCRIGENCRRTAVDRYDWTAIERQLVEAYERIGGPSEG